MRFRQAIAASMAALLCGGCYSSRHVRGSDVAALRGPADDGVAVTVHGEGATRLDPTSMIRFRRRDGSQTRWFAARNLLTSHDGVLVSFAWEPIASVRRAWVSNLGAEDAARLEAVRPLTAELKDHGSQLELVPPADGLEGWLRAFLALRSPEEAVAADEEWQFSVRGVLAAVRAADLRGALTHGVPRIDGLRWDDVAQIEIRNFDGVATFFTVVSAPLWLAAVVLIGRVGGGPIITAVFEEGPARINADAPSQRVPGGEVVRDEVIHQGNVLSSGLGTAPDASSATRVFSPAAVRRSVWRPVVWLGGGSQLEDGQSASITVGGAARLSDVIELGVGITTWWPDFDGPDPLRPGAPLVPGPPRWVPYVAIMGRAGADFAVDARRRLSLPVLVEVASGGEEFLQLRLRYGVRVRAVGDTFVGVHPFNPHYTEQRLPGLNTWTFPSTLEFGSTF